MPGDLLPSPNPQEHFRLQAALRESEILRELAELLASSLDLERILQVLVKRTTQVCEVERCAVWLLEDARGMFHPKTYHLSTQLLDHQTIQTADAIWYRSPLPFDNPVIHRLLSEQGMLYVEDLRDEPGLRRVAETFLVRSILLVALVREGRPVGILSLDDPAQARTFSPELQQLARAIGQQAAIAIDNARLYQQAQTEKRRAEELIDRARSIHQVALTVNSSEDLSSIFTVAMDHLVRGLGADGGVIALLESDALSLVNGNQNGSTMLDAQSTVKLDHLPNCRHAALTGQPMFVAEEQIEGDEILWYRKSGLHNTMIVPLMVNTKPDTKDGGTVSDIPARCVGLAFVNYFTRHVPPSKGQFAYAQDIAAQCALAVEKIHLLSEVRQAAQAANERATTLDAIFHAMTEGITVADMQGNVLVLNNAASHFLGIPKNFRNHLNNFLRRYPTYTVDGRIITEEQFPLTRALQGERIRSERFVTRRADGEERILEINIAPMLDSSERQIGVVSAFRDVTEPIRAEQRIRQALDTMLHVAEAVSGITDIKQILRNVLERSLTILNCQRGSIHLFDEEQQKFTPLLTIGFTEENEERWLEDQRIWLDPEPGQYHGFYSQLLAGHPALINAEQCPHQLNPLQHTMVLAAPIKHDNRVHGLIVLDRSQLHGAEASQVQQEPSQQERHEFSIWDIAVLDGIAQLAGMAVDQAHWQQEAIEARTSEAAMREANALKDEFLAITAHEFRSPLTVILAQTQLVVRNLARLIPKEQEDNSEIVAKAVKNLSIVEDQTRQLTDIVQTFLEVSHLNRGNLTLSLTEVNLAEIARQVVVQSSTTTQAHTIACLLESGEQSYLVEGDSARLQQIIANLVDNAIKYSPFGGPITVRLRRCADSEGKLIVEVCVQDKGMGVPPDAQSRLFERFYRAPNSIESQTKGIGLGLYIVAQLIQMHGGAIHVESNGVLGEGSCFIFTLPALERKREIEHA